MVTTRIRGLIQSGSEVAIGTLPQRDALKLLAATAEVEEYAPPEKGEAEGSDQYHMACEVVKLCGYLALTVFNQTTSLNFVHKTISFRYQSKILVLEWHETTLT